MTVREALRLAHEQELERDERVLVLGEEVGLFDGSYRVTAGPDGALRRAARA